MLLLVRLALIFWICFSLGQETNEQSATTPPPKKATARPPRGKSPATGIPIKRVLVDDEVRVVNWCVTGRDEIEMQYYPYSEFQPYLARTDSTVRIMDDSHNQVKYDYQLRLDEIKFTVEEKDIEQATGGLPRSNPDYTPIGKMHNTAHLKFNAYKLRAMSLGVKQVRKPSPIEGLVIQVNHSPLGIGTATAQFVDPEFQVICSDCRHPQGRPVGCRKRTKNDIIHPTIMVYHHEMRVDESFRNRTNPRIESPPCSLCKLDGRPGVPRTFLCRCTDRSHEITLTPRLGRRLDCANKPPTQDEIPDCPPENDCQCYGCFCQRYRIPPDEPEQFCKCSDPQPNDLPIQYEDCPEEGIGVQVRPCNPLDEDAPTPACSCAGPLAPELGRDCLTQIAPVSLRPRKCRCVDTDPFLPEAVQACDPVTPEPDCGDTGIDDNPIGKCRRKVRTFPMDCLKDNTARGCPGELEYAEYVNSIASKEYLGKSDEVHANLQWYFPPCLRSRAVEFSVLIVHSFAKQEYDVVLFGPYELPSLQTYPDQNQHVPSPYFHGYSRLYVCDDPTQVTTIVPFSDRSPIATYPFGYSYNYDLCIRNLSTEEKDGGQFCLKPEAARCDEEDLRQYSVIVERSCDEACEVTTAAPNITENRRLTPHGAINIITNFCVQPIAIFIGRYYKETLNRKSFKGMDLWYWVHLLGSGVASIAMYVGYFHPVWLPRFNPHIIAGQTIMILLAITYIVSWIRHTNKWLRITAEFIHGMFGYTCSFMAYWCLHTVSHKVSTASFVLIYIATACLGVGYIIMEGCIFYWDRKFGMQPLRRHFPTVEARLGDLPTPGTSGRIFFLFLLTSIMLVLTVIAALLPPRPI